VDASTLARLDHRTIVVESDLETVDLPQTGAGLDATID
jgi:hypothetical protein